MMLIFSKNGTSVWDSQAMAEIRVSTDELKNGANTLSQLQEEVVRVYNHIDGAVTGIGDIYDGQLNKSLAGITEGSMHIGAQMQMRVGDLLDELRSRANGFEKANEFRQQLVHDISARFSQFFQEHPGFQFLSFLQFWKDKGVKLWGMAGLAAGSLGSLFFVTNNQNGAKAYPQLQNIGANSQSTSSGFGKLIEKPVQERQAEETIEEKAAEKVVQPEETSQWWLDVPTQSQQGLELNGKPNAYACTPTSTSMVLDYWHNKDSKNKTMSAQELIDLNVKEGEFSSTGMSASDMHDEIKNLGYSVAEDHTNSDLDDLKNAVAQGPVIAVVKLGMKATGTNHAVVVTGISSDNQVRINDPWDGKSKTYSLDEFSKSWGADYGKGIPKNNFIVFRP